MPWNAAASLINGMQDRKVSLFNTAVNVGMNWYNQRKEQQMNQYNWEMQKEINQQNRDWELEDQAYLAQREDTAIQRRAKDLQEAGINPLLAGGIGGADSGLQGTRNTSGFTPGKFTPLPNPLDTSGFRTPLLAGDDPIDGILDKFEQLERIKSIKSGTKGKDLENIEKEITNQYLNEKITKELEQMSAGTSLTKEQQKKLVQEYGFRASQEEREKALHTLEIKSKELENDLKKLEQDRVKLQNKGIEQNQQQEQQEFEMRKQDRILMYLKEIRETISAFAKLK